MWTSGRNVPLDFNVEDYYGMKSERPQGDMKAFDQHKLQTHASMIQRKNSMMPHQQRRRSVQDLLNVGDVTSGRVAPRRKMSFGEGSGEEEDAHDFNDEDVEGACVKSIGVYH